MALTDTDRRRFFLATTLTLLALPALWWVNQSENSAAPNVAVAGAGAGVDVGADHDADDDTVQASGDTQEVAAVIATSAGGEPTSAPPADPATGAGDEASSTVDEAVGAIAPVFLDGPSGHVNAGLAEIAVPARPQVDRVDTTATFRSHVGSNSCVVPGIVNGQTITVVNLDNNRSVTCVTTLAHGMLAEQITLSTSMFSELADLTDAPIPVEIRR